MQFDEEQDTIEIEVQHAKDDFLSDGEVDSEYEADQDESILDRSRASERSSQSQSQMATSNSEMNTENELSDSDTETEQPKLWSVVGAVKHKSIED